MVKNDWGFLGFTYIACGFFALIWGVFFLTSLNDENKWNYLFNTAALLALAISTFVQARRWKPMNKRRQLAAASGFAARIPLATAHPLPNVAALPLPFIITLRPNWPKFVIALGMLVGTFVISDASAYQNHDLHIINLYDPLELIFFLFPVVVVGLLSVLLISPQRVEITSEGMTIRHAFGRILSESIRWSDARLFAIRGGKPGTPGTRYELSCPYEVVEWTRICRPRWWSLQRPAIPFAEYDAQMDALIALISGITGLPLYDIR